VPDSTRRIGALLPFAVIFVLSGCGGVPSISIPSIPSIPDISKHGGASFSIDGTTFQVSQSGSIQTDFGKNPLTYSGPDGCRGHYFSGDYTENIQVFFRYFPDRAYLLIDNGAGPIYVFGPPRHQGKTLVYNHPTPRGRDVTVTVACPRTA
jgi:hypothetical protein